MVDDEPLGGATVERIGGLGTRLPCLRRLVGIGVTGRFVSCLRCACTGFGSRRTVSFRRRLDLYPARASPNPAQLPCIVDIEPKFSDAHQSKPEPTAFATLYALHHPSYFTGRQLND